MIARFLLFFRRPAPAQRDVLWYARNGLPSRTRLEMAWVDAMAAMTAHETYVPYALLCGALRVCGDTVGGHLGRAEGWHGVVRVEGWERREGTWRN